VLRLIVVLRAAAQRLIIACGAGVVDSKFVQLNLVMLNSFDGQAVTAFQHPSCHTNDGLWGEMDPETGSG
jgi:hypothetical protein